MNTDYFKDLVARALPEFPSVPGDGIGTGEPVFPVNARLSPVAPVSPPRNSSAGEHGSVRSSGALARPAAPTSVLLAACRGLPISPSEIRSKLADEDLEGLAEGRVGIPDLRALARVLVERRAMERGEVPEDWIHHAKCRGCGPIWFWTTGNFLGCPWCHVRAKGLPVPSPTG